MSNLPKFRELGLSDAMLDSLTKKGFEEPTPIQAKTIPFLLTTTKDLIGKAQTGTGKTAAFGIPLIEQLAANSKKVQAIILAPTRELAIQVAEELSSFAEEKKARIAVVYGGAPIERQIAQLRRGVDIIVGTPGRVIDHLQRKTLDISEVSYVVLDEADEMLNMGFVEDIETILKVTPPQRRVVLFSATMPAHIERLAKQYMKDYEVISVASTQLSRDNIEQIYFEVPQSDKFEALYRIIDVEASFYGLIFVRTKLDADDVAHKLSNRGVTVEAIHGDLSQAQREKVLKKFRDKKISVLVATDVAARGIDIDNLTHVINYSLPQDPESYVHRIGRTGRAGKSGTAITLITPSEYRKLVSLQRVTNSKINKKKLPLVSDVIESKKNRIKTSLAEIIAEGQFTDMKDVAKEILTDHVEAEMVLAALLKMAFKDQLSEKNYSEIGESNYKRSDNFSDDRVSNNRFSDRSYVDSKGCARLFIAKGRMDGFDVRKLVGFIQESTGVNQSRIDDVKILDSFSFFAAPFEDAEKILNAFKKMSDGGKSLVSKAKDKEPGDRGPKSFERSNRGERSGEKRGGFNRERKTFSSNRRGS